MSYMYDLIFLVEEESMKAMLDILLPRFVPKGITFLCIPHEGKQDLEKSIPRKLKVGNMGNKFIILRDQDSGDCVKIKENLRFLCQKKERLDTRVIIVCHELESWFLGDLEAVEKAFNLKSGNLSKKQTNRKYKDPDRLNSAKQELCKLVPSYQQISGSKKIAKYLEIENVDKNCSHSFKFFLREMRKILEGFNQQGS